MRGRKKILRKIGYIPEITYFKPAGIPLRNLQEEILSFDEVEAIRLSDLDDLDQEDAAQKMGISRITYLRILHNAHNKIAKSLIYGKAIQMKGGENSIIFNSGHRLKGGDVIMPNLDGTGPVGQGPRTGRGQGWGQKQGQGLGGTAECVCPNCGEKAPHTRGVPCSETKCPKCQSPMAGVFCRFQ